MPEFATKNPSVRKQVDPRDTFGWTVPNLKVTARPTDPYVAPQKSPDTQALIETLRTAPELTNGFIQYNRNLETGNAQKGKADAAQGKPAEKPEGLFNMGIGYQEAYDVTEGEARALRFHKEAETRLAENNFFQNSEDPQKAYKEFMDGLYSHHFGSVAGNDRIMFGASEQLNVTTAAMDTAFRKASFDTAKTHHTNNVSAAQRDLLFVYANSEQTEADLGKLRQMITDGWEFNVKPTNFMTRDEYSRLIVSNIGAAALEIAQDPNKPTSEALAAARKLTSLYRAPDPQNGQSWASMVDAEGKLKFRAEIEHYQARLNAIQTERDAADANALKLQADTEEKDLFAAVVLDPDTPLALKKSQILSAKYLSANQIQDLIGKAEIFQKEEKHIVQDFRHITYLRRDIEMAGSEKELLSLRRAVMGSYGIRINSDTFKELDLRITSRIEHLKSEGRADRAEARANRSLTLEERKLGYDMLEKVIGKQTLEDEDGSVAAYRMDHYGRRFFARVNSGESPQQVSSDLIQEFSKNIGRTAADIEGPSKYLSEEDIKADVDSGKIRPDEGIKELLKFRATKRPPL